MYKQKVLLESKNWPGEEGDLNLDMSEEGPTSLTLLLAFASLSLPLLSCFGSSAPWLALLIKQEGCNDLHEF